jgi:hypothetical protein
MMLCSSTASSTDASFLGAGTYTLRVTVSDGQLSESADVIVTVLSAPSLTLLVSKSGSLLGGMITSIKESSSDPQVTRLELYIDDNKVAFADYTSVTYRWDLNVTGTHVVSGRAYNSNNVVVATASQSVSVLGRTDLTASRAGPSFWSASQYFLADAWHDPTSCDERAQRFKDGRRFCSR